MAIVKCPDCGETYNESQHWDVCPHRPLKKAAFQSAEVVCGDPSTTALRRTIRQAMIARVGQQL